MDLEKLKVYKTSIQKLQKIDFSYFYKDSFGELSLRKHLDNDFEFITSNLIKAEPFLDKVDSDTFDLIVSTAKDFEYYLTQIALLSDNDFLAKRPDIVTQISYYKNLVKKFTPAILVYQNTEKIEKDNDKSKDQLISLFNQQIESLMAENEEKIKKIEQQTSTDANTISNLKSQLESEIKEINERYASDLAGFELLKQEEIFAKTAQKNKKESIYWIAGIVLCSIVLIITTYYFSISCWYDFNCYINSKSVSDNSQTINFLLYYELFKRAVLRFFILSILILLLKFVLKNFNALMHNHTVNSHKANCFAAAFRIINSIQNENIKASILNLAGKEIFIQQKTGYLSKDETKFDISILEKISAMMSNIKKEE